jgi:hypothetical protein
MTTFETFEKLASQPGDTLTVRLAQAIMEEVSEKLAAMKVSANMMPSTKALIESLLAQGGEAAVKGQTLQRRVMPHVMGIAEGATPNVVKQVSKNTPGSSALMAGAQKSTPNQNLAAKPLKRIMAAGSSTPGFARSFKNALTQG